MKLHSSVMRAILICSLFQYAFGQEQSAVQFVCGTPVGETTIITQGERLPAQGTLRALWIVCKFSDDNFNLSPFTDRWPSSMNTPQTFPSWTRTLLDSTQRQNYTFESIGGWYREMSLGNLHIIGDVYNYVPKHEQAYYFRSPNADSYPWSDERRRGLGYLNKEVLQAVDSLYNINFSVYDSWKKENGQWINLADGVVDLIIITYRFHPKGNLTGGNYFTGLAMLDWYNQDGFFPITIDGKQILHDRGVTNEFSAPEGGIQTTAHEIGHLLYGYYHNVGIGINIAGFNAYERWQMGWLNFRTENSDKSITDLNDFITTGQVIKIPTSDPTEFFLIENHQKLSPYETLARWHGGPPQFAGNPGLYIFHVDEKIPQSFESLRLYAEIAEGKYNWRTTTVSGITYYNYPFEIQQANVVNGVTRINLPDRGVYDTQSSTVRNLTHSETVSGGIHGTQFDTFHEGFKTEFSYATNPATNLSQGDHSGSAQTSIALRNIRKISGTNLMAFDLQVTPPAPALASPANNSTNVVTAPTLTWSAVSGATGYHVQIGANSAFLSGTIMLEDETLTTSSRQVGLVPSTTYYWRVRAKNAAGWGAWSGTNSFTSSATLANNTVWAGLIRLTQTVTVLAGNTLTVLPGTTLKINGETSLSVSGTLVAEGTLGSRIIIDGEDPSRTYGSPMINPIDNGSLSLKYADVMNKYTQVKFDATGSITVDHCTFTEFDKIVPYSTVYGFAIVVSRYQLSANIGAVTITNNVVTCRRGLVDGTPWGGGWGISISYAFPTTCTITNNTVENCYVGIYAYTAGGTVTVTDNAMNNNNYGIGSWWGTCNVSSCTFTGNNIGIWFSADQVATVTNSTFQSAGKTGIVCQAGTNATLQSNNFASGLSTGVSIVGVGTNYPTTVRMYSNTITSAITGIAVDWSGVAYIGDNLGGGTGGNIITGCNTGIRIGSGSGTVQIRHNQILATNYDHVGIELHAPITLENNTIRGGLAARSADGILLYPPSNANFQHNTFSHWSYALWFDDWMSGWQGFSLNNFESNYYAVFNSFENSMDILASPNWWGTTNESQVRWLFYGNINTIYYSPICTTRYPYAGPYGQSPPANSMRPDSDGDIKILKPLTDSQGTSQLPQEFGLSQNYPNPFNPSTVISYQLPKEGFVGLKIYDVLGKEVRMLVDGTRGAGFYSVTWDGKDNNGNVVGSGIYIYRLVSSEMESKGKERFSTIKKMLLVR